MVEDAARAEAEEARRVKIADLRKKIAEKAGQEDYVGAATVQAELTNLQQGTIPSVSAPKGKGAGKVRGADHADPVAQAMSIADLNKAGVAIPTLVNLESLQILSVGKLTSVPAKSGAKGKKKGKGKDKNQGKDRGNGTGQNREDVKVMYLGQDGFIICTAAFGTCVEKTCHMRHR